MSPLLAPDLPEIERALDSLLQKYTGARILAMRSPIRRAWPEYVERGGCRFRIEWCPSELEVRERLDEAEGNDSGGLIVLTPLDAATLGDDVVARFPHARLEQSDRWSALRGAFRASKVDPRLRAYGWLADLLLEHSPVGGYPPAAGGILDLESAWRAVFDDVLGIADGRTDAAALLDWTLDGSNLDRFARFSEQAQSAVAERVSSEGGPAAGLVLAAAAAGRGADALPIALACGVVFADQNPDQVLREAAIRLEPLVGGAQVNPEAAHILAEAGRRVLDRLPRESSGTAAAIESRAASILTMIRAESFAALSQALQIGLDARIRDAAVAILHAVETRLADDVQTAWQLTRRADRHDRAGNNRTRVDRLLMAVRLLSWLAGRPNAPSWRSISEASAAYFKDSAFVDRARHTIRSGDPLPDVSAIYSRLGEAVTALREEENRAFAVTLREWNSGGSVGDTPLPVERILSSVVAPMAKEAPVLLLVLDGLSLAVWRALAETIVGFGWSELVPTQGPIIAAAVLPSVTAVSRTSLLCGSLRQGDQAVERAGFATNGSLVAASRSGYPPRLFHKADIGAGPELGEEIRAAVADPQRRIVGVVHNAVDAQLSGSDQVDLAWTAEGLRQVAALLHVARSAGRTLIVTSDHGHILDEATVQLSGDSGSRWRSAGTPPSDLEVALAGGRILSPSGEKAIVAAWSERVRFGARRSGYHGGASPQEVLVPVAVYTAGAAPGGWSEAPSPEPSWWRGTSEDVSQLGVAAVVVPPPSRRRQAVSRQADLFAQERTEDTRRPLQTPVELAWLDDLFASETFSAQRRLAGRGAPQDDQVRGLISALAARGGRMTRVGLSQALGMPAFRIAGLISAARRVLNLDQAQVLREEADDVVLNEPVLKAQFHLGDGR
ncbi:BREX-2 system phosphatase PglZ [Mesorhizobium sp. VK24D]|uniref:BREX-2 system phosphatase PglZ n=1 Tax=Mesorhizobium album TaxID=3072314 RepID=A0ABU4Y884_9HYPH|nr:BREX-2 system phosphatase PglZ [Mesorhizobium sp. VK24D]MDX8483147.1 BREX-2 system phosphatase PglZ [Mesorhizobium sp. VK24D]